MQTCDMVVFKGEASMVSTSSYKFYMLKGCIEASIGLPAADKWILHGEE